MSIKLRPNGLNLSIVIFGALSRENGLKHDTQSERCIAVEALDQLRWCSCFIVNNQAKDPVCISPARLNVAIITPDGEEVHSTKV